jgi:cysteine-rich repeat protein
MRRYRATSLALLGVIAATTGLARDALALTACTAAQIISQDSGCPSGSGPCTITKDFTVGDACILDFGTRALTIGATGKLLTAPGAVTIRAASLTIAPRGFIDARGTAAPIDLGGFVTIETTGAVDIQQSGGDLGRINVSGDMRAGTLRITAGGSVNLAGEISANNLSTNAAGGSIVIDAGGDIVTQPSSVLSATGGIFGTGTLDLMAGGRVDLGETVDITGDEGGIFDIGSGSETVVRRVRGDATGDTGSGGCFTVSAGTRIDLLGVISLTGSSSIDGTSGGCGGVADLEADFGDVTVTSTGQILAIGAGPDGGGGEIDVTAAGSLVVQAGGILSAASNGGQGCGGMICVDTNLGMTNAGRLDASGGYGGGSIDVSSAGDIAFGGVITAAAFTDGGFGGDISAEAGFDGTGSLAISGLVDAGGGRCNDVNGCGDGGSTDLSGCNVTVTSTAQVLAVAANGGTHDLLAREQLTINGQVSASGVGTGTPGTNTFEHPSRTPPIVTGPVTPPATVNAFATCTGPGQALCLDPCPTCGNGVAEFPETCDDVVGTPVSCDGCSRFCRMEACNDPNICTIDSCDPILGCRHVNVPDGTSCADGLVCNGVEQCFAGVCLATARPDCNDNNICTSDPCVEPTGCTHAPEPAGSFCTDNNACTVGDACDGAGACRSTGPLVCNDTNECTTDTCSTVNGCVFTARTGNCTDDGNVCTTDVCNAGACTHPNRPNGTTCDDGMFCSVGDSCQNGSCAPGPARNCADTNACTADRCDDTLDACMHDPIIPCCGNGVPEAPGEECDDGNTSNSDACVTGCRNARCGDGFVRTGVEQCDLGAGNADTPNAGCRTDCRLPRCGDGIIDTARGEQCDDGGAVSGDGCSARCFIEPPSTFGLIAGKGSAVSDCATEWGMDRPALNRKGIPDTKQRCRDGDASCDFGTTAGECLFHVWLCANNHDPRLPFCTPGSGGTGSVVQVDPSKPSSKDAARRVEDAQNRSQMVPAAIAAQTAGFDDCGPVMTLRVPIKSATKAGTKKFKVKARTAIGVIDSDSLKLSCSP